MARWQCEDANDELILADAVVRVRANPAFFSLNLAQAVLLIAYEWFQAGSRAPARRRMAPTGRPATKGELAGLVEHLVGELDAAGFFRSADRRKSMVPALEAILARAELHEPDVHLLRGVVKALARGRPGTRWLILELGPARIPRPVRGG